MIEKIQIEPFEARFEDLQIWVQDIQLEIIDQMKSQPDELQTALTTLWHNANVVGFPDTKDLVGKFFILFRNQGNDFDLALLLEVDARVRPLGGGKSADTVCKYLQFLFDWMKDYVKKEGIVDKQGHPFIVPDFYYAKSQFEQEFPD